MITAEQLQKLKQQDSDVPCNGCTACCQRDRIVLTSQDDPNIYLWHFEGEDRVLNRRDNGQCIYLGQTGCNKYKERPESCRKFDCRILFLITPKTKRRIRIEQNQTMRAVYAAGRARLKTLEQ